MTKVNTCTSALLMSAVLLAACGSSGDNNSAELSALEERINKLEAENAELKSDLEAASALTTPATAEETSDEPRVTSPSTSPPTVESTIPTTVPMTAPPTTAAVTTAAPPSEPVLTVASGFTAYDNVSTAGAIVTNNGPAACGVDVQFSLLNSQGIPVDTMTETIAFLLPGESRAVAPLQIGYEVTDVATLDVSIVKVDGVISGTSYDDCGGFSVYDGVDIPVSNAALVAGSFSNEISGQLSNPSSELVESAYIDCVIMLGGVIVGGESSGSRDPIPPGGTIAFDLGFVHYEGQADQVICSAFA
jgi:hypothetical protein